MKLKGDYLERLFRARGIKVRVGNIEPHRMKIYYEPSKELLSLNSEVMALAERFDCLEYAIADGNVDAINFHTNCQNVDDISSKFNSELIASIGIIFDPSYKPYTLGYRLNGGMSIYFYPTVWKETRYGIRGLTDRKLIENQLIRFLSFISASNDCKNWILNQIPYIEKFKGVCITNYKNKNSFKLYYRITSQGIRTIFSSYCDVEEYCNKYGNVVLTSVSIVNGEVDSFNLYFLR